MGGWGHCFRTFSLEKEVSFFGDFHNQYEIEKLYQLVEQLKGQHPCLGRSLEFI